MSSLLDKAAAIRLRTAYGLFEREGVLHRACVAATLAGVREVEEGGRDVLAIADAVAMRVTGLLKLIEKRRSKPQDAEADEKTPTGAAPTAESKEAASQAAREVTIGVGECAVTFTSAVDRDTPGASSSVSDREAQKSEQKGGKMPQVVSASQSIMVGKKRIKLSARVRVSALDAACKRAGLDSLDGGVYEPAPWAAWRASLHHAPLRPRRGLHLRFLLGERGGLAVLGTANGPLAWQVLSWEDPAALIETMAQASSLLEIHARRRLGLDAAWKVSVQGADPGERVRGQLGALIGADVDAVAGPPYDAEFVSLGLALGALAGNTQALNLAASLQSQKTLLKRVPWVEVVVLTLLLGGMYLVLDYYRGDLAQQLAVATQRNSSVPWAVKLSDGALKKELSLLKNQVAPLQKYMSGRLSFSRTISALASELPAKTWLVSITAEDLVWEKNPNKTLGETYVMLAIGAPADRRGDVPPEINDTVRALVENPYMSKSLPRIKLADVVWQDKGGEGHSLFSILSLPKD